MRRSLKRLIVVALLAIACATSAAGGIQLAHTPVYQVASDPGSSSGGGG